MFLPNTNHVYGFVLLLGPEINTNWFVLYDFYCWISKSKLNLKNTSVYDVVEQQVLTEQRLSDECSACEQDFLIYHVIIHYAD